MISTSSRRVYQLLPVLAFVSFLIGLRILADGGAYFGLALTLVSGLAAMMSVAVLILANLPAEPVMLTRDADPQDSVRACRPTH